MTDDERKAILAEARANVARHLREQRAETIRAARETVADWRLPEHEPPPPKERKLDTAPQIEIIPPQPASSAKEMVLTVARETVRTFKQYGAEMDRLADQIDRLRKDSAELKTMVRDLKAPQWLSDEIAKVLEAADKLEAAQRSRLH
jgi:hypothetical protein